MKRLFALVLLAVGFTTSAHAAFIETTWTDSIDFGSGAKIGWFDSVDFTHNLKDRGFRPGVDKVEDFRLSINLGGQGLAYIDLPSATLLEGDGLAGLDFTASGEDFGGWSILGLMNLNSFGTLSVTITSLLGEFKLLSSTLTANGYSNATSVPEPGALGLLGVGLLGMVVGMRRRKQPIR